MNNDQLRFFEPSPLLHELQILLVISRNPGSSQRKIAQEVGLSPSMVHNYLRTLERRGLVRFRGTSHARLQYVPTGGGIARAEFLAGCLLAETSDLMQEITNRARHAIQRAAGEGVRVLGVVADPQLADALADIAEETGVSVCTVLPREGDIRAAFEALPSRPDAVMIADDATRKEISSFLEACHEQGVPVRSLV